MSRRLVLGSMSRQRLVGLSPLGVVNGREIFPIAGAEDDGTANPGDDADDDAQDDEDEDDDSEDDEDAKDKKKRPRSRNNRGAGAEFAKIRRERNQLLREKAEREKAEREAALKEKPEIERARAELSDATTERDSLREQLSDTRMELEILKASMKKGKNGQPKFSWVDLDDVLNDRTLRKSIEIGEDGEIIGVDDALKELASRKPHYLVQKSDEDGKSSSNNGTGTGTGTNGTNGKSGGNPGTNNGKGDLTADRERLGQIYPILNR